MWLGRTPNKISKIHHQRLEQRLKKIAYFYLFVCLNLKLLELKKVVGLKYR